MMIFQFLTLVKELKYYYQSISKEQQQQMFQDKIRSKSSLCRFYVRGLCNSPKEQCTFAHGIDDLDYQPWQQGQDVEYDYLKQTEFCQRKAVKGPKNYISLYQFQPIKKYTLQVLNSNRAARVEVRSEFHKKLFNDFMQLMEKVYKDANITQEILLRQYTRVGFNKLMTRIKFSHLTDFLCEGENPKYYMKSMLMPPLLTSQRKFIFKRAPEEEIINCYRQQYIRIVKQSQEIDQATIKKKLYKMYYPNYNIPPLNMILKEKKINFTNFIKILNSNENELIAQKIKPEATVEEIAKEAVAFLQSLKGKLTNWNEVYAYLSKKLKINNGNLINQIKPLLVNEGYQFLFFPMLQIILPNGKFEIDHNRICKCKYHQSFDLSAYEQEFNQKQVKLGEGESIDIYDWESLMKHAKNILQSKILGVDLEGTLRKGGFVQMLQLNNSQNTFLIDYYQLQQKKDEKTLELVNKIIRNIFVNEKVIKIFHDSRHDSLALHECLKTCIINVFDTSAVQTLKGQIQAYKNLQINNNAADVKNIIAECTNVRTFGLNDIFKKYNASHGQNKNKQRFHKMWKEGVLQLFLLRPLHPDYREYCIRDVLDLPQIHDKMINELSQQMVSLGRWISAHYISFGFNICTQGELLLNETLNKIKEQ